MARTVRPRRVAAPPREDPSDPHLDPDPIPREQAPDPPDATESDEAVPSLDFGQVDVAVVNLP